MKKSTASITLVIAAGLTALSASPAMAAPFQNCTEAAAAGAYNIPATSPLYGTHLDRDLDNVGCENSSYGPYQDVVTAPEPTVAPVPPVTQVPQVVQVPVGGASTGIAQDTTDNTAALALGAGLVLAAAAGGTFVVRRRGAQA